MKSSSKYCDLYLSGIRPAKSGISSCRRDQRSHDVGWVSDFSCKSPEVRIEATSSSLVAVANPRGVLPNWQAPSLRTCIRSVIVDGLENRQRTIGSAWSSNGSALES